MDPHATATPAVDLNTDNKQVIIKTVDGDGRRRRKAHDLESVGLFLVRSLCEAQDTTRYTGSFLPE